MALPPPETEPSLPRSSGFLPASTCRAGRQRTPKWSDSKPPGSAPYIVAGRRFRSFALPRITRRMHRAPVRIPARVGVTLDAPRLYICDLFGRRGFEVQVLFDEQRALSV